MTKRPGGPLQQREQHHTGAELVQYAIDQRLIQFAKTVLRIMETTQDWSADTSEAICNAAIAANVAGFKDGFFHAKST